MNFGEILRASAAAEPERLAVSAGAERITYGELCDRALRVAGALHERGVVPGDVVAVMLPNGVDFAAAYYGTLFAGAAVACINPLLAPAGVDGVLADSGARIAIGRDPVPRSGVTVLDPDAAGAGARLPAPVPRDDADTGLLLYSSGTTAEPKAAEMTHGNLSWSSAALLAIVGRPSAALCAAPFFQGFGLGCGMNAMIRAGASIFTRERWDAAAALAAIERERLPLILVVPAMCHDLLGLPDLRERDTSALRLCLTGAAAMPEELLLRFEREFGCEVLEGYGCAEALRAAMNHPGRRRPGSIGLPLDGMEYRIADAGGTGVAEGVGELLIRGPNVMRGYWRKPEATAEVMRDGWLRTRDLAYATEEGFLWVVGRVDDVISRGGYKVHPVEVERVLCEHPGVAEAAVIGLPDERLGNEVGAAVVPASGYDLDADELRAFVRERVARWKYPRRIWTVESLPHGFTGKVLRREVRPPPPERSDVPG
jgi:long-chain acyl-CoA synthetase